MPELAIEPVIYESDIRYGRMLEDAVSILRGRATALNCRIEFSEGQGARRVVEGR